MPSLSPELEKTLKHDKVYLEETEIPIITVSASYKEDLKALHGLPENETTPDIVFSRAHYSMALGIATHIWGKKMDHKKAWIVDPTNYVSHKDWRSIQLTELIGKTLARQPLLKQLKNFVDRFGRNKLPILKSITPPLLYLTENISYPILSLHIAAGNILSQQGKSVVQVITDPHVRHDYLNNAHRDNMIFCVFDSKTKTEFLEKAALLKIKVDPERVIVTGPPIDPRVVRCKEKKHPWRNGVLKLCITTGGLGTNKRGIKKILQQLLPKLRKHPSPYQILIYAGTQKDIYEMVQKLAKKEHVSLGKLSDDQAKLRIIYHPQIVDANELLLTYGFPWADGFITKPSGDMAYDAVTSGNFLLTLKEWGEWEHNIREIFEQLEISREAKIDEIVAQLESLQSAEGKAQSWVERAMHNAQTIDSLFLNGSKKIVEVVRNS